MQCGHTPRMAYVSFVLAVNTMAKEAGWEVDLRPVVPGESLDRYDKIIAFVAPLRGFVAKHALGLLWTLHVGGDRVIVSFDDWQVTGATGSFKALLGGWDKVMGTNQFGYSGYDESKPYWGSFKELLARCDSELWPWPALIPAYVGGDLSLLRLPVLSTKVKVINPSALFANRYGREELRAGKVNQWVLAALHNHQSWLKKQKLTWEVLQFGARSLGQPRLKEHEIFDVYRKSGGALSPAYNICGSGWWRARYGFAADALCVIAGSPKELAMVGGAYSKTPQEVEQLGEALLADLAAKQREQYYAAAGTVGQVQDAFQAALQ